jgi:uncharacterized protein
MELLPAPESFDLEALGDFLASEYSPAGCMQLSDLDGFLTGLAVGPDLIMPSEWLPVVWRTSEEAEFADEAEFEDAKQAVRAMVGRYNEIIRCLNAHKEIQPIPWISYQGNAFIGDWIHGFVKAMKLRPVAWKSLLNDPEARLLLMPIRILSGDPELIGHDEPVDEELVKPAREMLPSSVAGIRAYWLARGGRLN